MNEKENQPEISVLTKPFGNIALAFSGGGFRAGTFALGVLSYLEHVSYEEKEEPVSLLDHVKYLSSASGGTITTAMYALYSTQGKSFMEFYKALFEKLEGTILVEEALSILNNDKVWKSRPEKGRNLINAFALAYDKHLFSQASVGVLNENKISCNSHLEEVCFNSTELYNGLLFRQTIEMKTGAWEIDALYGNYNLSVSHETAQYLLLADLLAASSCFPGGFEPIVYPHDFTHSGAGLSLLRKGLKIELQELDWNELLLLYKKGEIEKTIKSQPHGDIMEFKEKLAKLPFNDDLEISLMDGGITDNQGVESMTQANERRVQSKKDAFDLMMVCDVSSHYMSAYQFPKNGASSFWTINRVRFWSLLLAGLSMVSFVGDWFLDKTAVFGEIIRATLAVIFAVSVVFFAFSEMARNIIKGQVSAKSGFNLSNIFSKRILKLLFDHFGNLHFNVLKNMVMTRLTTLVVLSNDVFLKRIRYLLYHQFFELKNMKATGRTKSNHIYDLSFSNDLNRNRAYSEKYQPSEEMQKTAENAFSMATTLWFTEADDILFRKASVIACGQFNTCYNLLDYIAKLKTSYNDKAPVFDGFSVKDKQLVNQFQERLEKDFDHFKQDPFWMYNQLGTECGINDFKHVKSTDIPFPDDFKGLRN